MLRCVKQSLRREGINLLFGGGLSSYNPRQKSLKHPLPLHSVEMTFYCLTGCNKIEKERGTNTVRECSKCFKVFVEDCNPRQKSLKHPLPLHSVEMTFYCLTGCNNIEKGRGTNTVRECSKCFKVFVEHCVSCKKPSG